MSKSTKLLLLFSGLIKVIGKSITVEEAKAVIDNLDKNKDGKLSVSDVALALLEYANRK
jgi:predicted CopG family antitoxin